MAPEQLTSVAVRNHHKEHLVLSRREILGVSARQTAYVEAELLDGKPGLSFVVPRGAPHPARIASGPLHSLTVVLVTASFMDLAPLQFSPAAPAAGTTVEFAAPGLSNGAAPEDTYTYKWRFGDGATSTEAAPKEAFPAAEENGTSNYEVSVEVVAWAKGQEVAIGTDATTVPVLTTTGRPPRHIASQPALIGASVGKGPHAGGGVRSGASVGRGGLGGGGLGGTGGRGRGGTAGHGRGIGGRAGPSEGNPNARASPRATHASRANGRTAHPTEAPAPSRAHGRSAHPIEAPVPARTEGRAPKATAKPAPAPPRPQPGLIGVLLESAGNALPLASLLQKARPPRPQPSYRAASRPAREATVSVLGALGLVAGILVVMFLVLSGAASEIRAGRFVR